MDDGARRLGAYELHPKVEYSMFVLRDRSHTTIPTAIPGGDWILLPGVGCVVFGTGGNDFYPDVMLEVWSSAPPPDRDEWDAIEESEFDVPTGRLRMCSVTGLPADLDVDVEAGRYRLRSDVDVVAGRYRLRAHCRGRREAAQRSEVELYYRGVEAWLAQMWPVAGLL